MGSTSSSDMALLVRLANENGLVVADRTAHHGKLTAQAGYQAEHHHVVRSIAARWTAVVASRGWTPIATLFLENYSRLGITATEAMFITHLMSFKRDTRMPYPSFAVIAEQMGVTPSAARGYARRLEKNGLINRVGRSGQTTEFDLTPLFEKLAAFDTKGHETGGPF